MPASVWWWPKRRHHRGGPEPVEQVALRLEALAGELDDATVELRAIVSGLRDVGFGQDESGQEGFGPGLGQEGRDRDELGRRSR